MILHVVREVENLSAKSIAKHCKGIIKPGFHYTANTTTKTQKQSDYNVEQSSFTLIVLFSLEIGRCPGRNWLNRNQAYMYQKSYKTIK